MKHYFIYRKGNDSEKLMKTPTTQRKTIKYYRYHEDCMNERTAKQIEEMKKQTIGVEVEMNSITRQRAAELAADFFGTNRVEFRIV